MSLSIFASLDPAAKPTPLEKFSIWPNNRELELSFDHDRACEKDGSLVLVESANLNMIAFKQPIHTLQQLQPKKGDWQRWKNYTLSNVGAASTCSFFILEKALQSRPIEMRAKILYIANRWMVFQIS